jgi:hypothetical protein
LKTTGNEHLAAGQQRHCVTSAFGDGAACDRPAPAHWSQLVELGDRS